MTRDELQAWLPLGGVLLLTSILIITIPTWFLARHGMVAALACLAGVMGMSISSAVLALSFSDDAAEHLVERRPWGLITAGPLLASVTYLCLSAYASAMIRPLATPVRVLMPEGRSGSAQTFVIHGLNATCPAGAVRFLVTPRQTYGRASGYVIDFPQEKTPRLLGQALVRPDCHTVTAKAR